MTPRTTEIPSADWMSALNAFSAAHEGWLVSIEVLSAGLGAQPAVINLPLVGVTFGSSDDSVTMTVGRNRGGHLTHVIQAPRRIAIERNERGADMALAVDAADGARTLLRFRKAVLPETVDGVYRP